ncbi:response regulator transcription factor [Rossellomorea aquimaris]|nr:helix-turn-helix transcriptional regulator [Rossellomorea vietnamensis]
MERSVTFLQNIQDAFANEASSCMVMVNQEGDLVSDFSNLDLLQEEHLFSESQLVEIIKPLGTLQAPVQLDGGCIAKIIAAPVYLRGELAFYILTFRYGDDLKDSDVLFSVKKCSEMMAEYLLMQEQLAASRNELKSIRKRLLIAQKEETSGLSVLKEIMAERGEYDIIGLALEKEGEQGRFSIDYAGGQGAPLLGHSFQIGEGFLGLTVAIEQFQFWKNASVDFRYQWFDQHGIRMRSFFCIPVYIDGKIRGVYFGGSTNKELDENATKEHAILEAALLGVIATSVQLRKDLHNHLMELSTFNEIFKVITSVEDIKRVLYILVDISINLIRGPFACIVSKPEKLSSNVEVVSRGLKADDINQYCAEVALKKFSKDSITMEVSEFKEQTRVIEIPLLFNNQVYGILCIGLPPNTDPDMYFSFLSSLAVAGGIALHLNHHRGACQSTQSLITMLQNVLADLAPDKHARALKRMQLIKEFSEYNGAVRTIPFSQASLLMEFDENVIDNIIEDKTVLSILEGCRGIQAGQKSKYIESEILFLINHYINHDRDVSKLHDLSAVSENLKELFKEFLNRNQVIESSVPLSAAAEEAAEFSAIDVEHLRKEIHLSTREIEVLNQVLKGRSNMEIANELFISEHTVKNHMTKILQKLRVSDRSQAIAKVYKLGYFPA